MQRDASKLSHSQLALPNQRIRKTTEMEVGGVRPHGGCTLQRAV